MESVRLSSEGIAHVEMHVKPFNQLALRPISFKLDTGAGITTISKEALSSLGYSDDWLRENIKLHETRTLSSAGRDFEAAHYVRIPAANLLGKDFIEWTFYIRPESDRDYRNLLGADIFSNFDFTFRYSTGFLEIEPITNSAVKFQMLDGQRIEEVAGGGNYG